MAGPRSPLEARAAERAAMERALSADLTGTELRVFLALCVKVTKFDRTADRVANSQLVELTGIAPRHVRSSLAGLAAKGVVDRVPGNGRLASLVTFPLPGGTDSVRPERTDPVPPEGTDSAVRGDAHAPPRGDAQRATSEVLSEALSEGEKPTADLVRSLIVNHGNPGEVDALAQKIEAEGRRDELVKLSGAGRRYSWPSDLRTALWPPQAPSRQIATVPRREPGPTCPSCSGRGVIYDEVTDLAYSCDCKQERYA